ncbi:MAG: 50S ribosomal protein L9 [Maricaulaceae bacterium]
MDVILLERVENLGAMGDVVKVRPGFARNFLLPQNKALRATDANKARFERERAALEKLNAERRADAQSAAEGLEGRSVTLIRQAGESGQLYGSVTSRDIAEALSEDGQAVRRDQVKLDTPIKALGLHSVRVRLHAEVSVEVSVNIARTEDEAERQLRGEDVIQTQLDEDRAMAETQAAELLEAAAEAEAEAGGPTPKDADAA